jgi:5'(3')-deoxyribonucleotidase
MRKLFIDMDGVLADFDRAYVDLFGAKPDRTKNPKADDEMWETIRTHGSFFRDLPLMPDAQELWDRVATYNPIILTGVPKEIPDAPLQKIQWAQHHLGRYTHVITTPSKNKCVFGRSGDILVDDWVKYKHRWEKMGGIWITHTSAASSIAQLQEYGY